MSQQHNSQIPPQFVGPYEIRKHLARGGMADVFLAMDTQRQRPVVVKTLLPSIASRADIVDLFMTEADVGRLLRHPHVVEVLDAGEDNGIYYLALEYVDGVDGHELLTHGWRQKQGVPVPVALRLAVDALKGLHAAHSLKSPKGKHLGLVHRDISPDNVFVRHDGVIKVADFGIAKLSGFEGKTQVGSLKGKLQYMSPEQAQGKELDGRSDGFSMAMVVVELMLGKPIHGISTQTPEALVRQKVLKADLGEAAEILKSMMPKTVYATLMKGLRRWRFWRYKNCGDFAKTLEQVAAENGVYATREQVKEYIAQVPRGAVNKLA